MHASPSIHKPTLIKTAVTFVAEMQRCKHRYAMYRRSRMLSRLEHRPGLLLNITVCCMHASPSMCKPTLIRFVNSIEFANSGPDFGPIPGNGPKLCEFDRIHESDPEPVREFGRIHEHRARFRTHSGEWVRNSVNSIELTNRILEGIPGTQWSESSPDQGRARPGLQDLIRELDRIH